MALNKLLILFTCLCVDTRGTWVVIHAAEFCVTDQGTDYEYCYSNCCGRTRNQYCCPNTVGIMIGAVIGGAILIGVAVCLIYCWCLHIHKYKLRVGIPINPSNGCTNQPVVTTCQPYTIYQGHQWPNQARCVASPQPPAYGFNPAPDPAYPPPVYPGYNAQNYGTSEISTIPQKSTSDE